MLDVNFCFGNSHISICQISPQSLATFHRPSYPQLPLSQTHPSPGLLFSGELHRHKSITVTTPPPPHTHTHTIMLHPAVTTLIVCDLFTVQGKCLNCCQRKGGTKKRDEKHLRVRVSVDSVHRLVRLCVEIRGNNAPSYQEIKQHIYNIKYIRFSARSVYPDVYIQQHIASWNYISGKDCLGQIGDLSMAH